MNEQEKKRKRKRRHERSYGLSNLPRYLAVEFPGYIDTLARAADCYGGHGAVREFQRSGKPLRLSMRPSEPFVNRVESADVAKPGVLIRVRRSRETGQIVPERKLRLAGVVDGAVVFQLPAPPQLDDWREEHVLHEFQLAMPSAAPPPPSFLPPCFFSFAAARPYFGGVFGNSRVPVSFGIDHSRYSCDFKTSWSQPAASAPDDDDAAAAAYRAFLQKRATFVHKHGGLTCLNNNNEEEEDNDIDDDGLDTVDNDQQQESDDDGDADDDDEKKKKTKSRSESAASRPRTRRAGPASVKKNPLSAPESTVLQLIELFFQVRPIWSVPLLFLNLCDDVDFPPQFANAGFRVALQRRLLPLVAVQASGAKLRAWRLLWIRKGFDPCTNAEARKFQIIDFRCSPEQTRPVPSVLAAVDASDNDSDNDSDDDEEDGDKKTDANDSGDKTKKRARKLRSKKSGEEETGCLGAKSERSRAIRAYLRSVIGFTAPPLKCQFFYCFCDIQLPMIKRIVDTALLQPLDAEQRQVENAFGWFTKDLYDQLRGRMKHHLADLLAKHGRQYSSRPPPPEGSAARSADAAQLMPLQVEGFALFE